MWEDKKASPADGNVRPRMTPKKKGIECLGSKAERHKDLALSIGGSVYCSNEIHTRTSHNKRNHTLQLCPTLVYLDQTKKAYYFGKTLRYFPISTIPSPPYFMIMSYSSCSSPAASAVQCLTAILLIGRIRRTFMGGGKREGLVPYFFFAQIRTLLFCFAFWERAVFSLFCRALTGSSLGICGAKSIVYTHTHRERTSLSFSAPEPEFSLIRKDRQSHKPGPPFWTESHHFKREKRKKIMQIRFQPRDISPALGIRPKNLNPNHTLRFSLSCAVSYEVHSQVA